MPVSSLFVSEVEKVEKTLMVRFVNSLCKSIILFVCIYFKMFLLFVADENANNFTDCVLGVCASATRVRGRRSNPV